MARCRQLLGEATCVHPECIRASRHPRGRMDGEDDLQVGDDLGLTWPEARRPPRPRGVRIHQPPEDPMVTRPEPYLSPECAVGKCPNCHGEAWDDGLDAPVACEHRCHLPYGTTPTDPPAVQPGSASD